MQLIAGPQLLFTGKIPTNDQPAHVSWTQTTCKTPLVTPPPLLLSPPPLFSSPSRGVKKKKKIYAAVAGVRQIAAWH